MPEPHAVSGLRVEVIRSARRRRTVSAHREGDVVVVRIPARMSKAEEARWVSTLVGRLERNDKRRRPGDAALAERARVLSARHLGGRAVPASVRWVDNQRDRWGSCTPADRTIRLSRRLQGMPEWVVDYVLLHELAHLLEPGHGPRFWALLDGYPRLERARGFLEGVAATAGLDLTDEPDDAPDDVAPDDAAADDEAADDEAADYAAADDAALLF